MLITPLKIKRVRDSLKKILFNYEESDPRITVQIYERNALMEVFRDVYNQGVAEGRRVEKNVLKNKLRRFL